MLPFLAYEQILSKNKLHPHAMRFTIRVLAAPHRHQQAPAKPAQVTQASAETLARSLSPRRQRQLSKGKACEVVLRAILRRVGMSSRYVRGDASVSILNALGRMKRAAETIVKNGVVGKQWRWESKWWSEPIF